MKRPFDTWHFGQFKNGSFSKLLSFFVYVNSFEKGKFEETRKSGPQGSKTKFHEKYLVEVLLTIRLTFVFTSTLLYSRLSYALGKIQRLSYQEQKGAHVGCSIILSPVNRDICNSHFSILKQSKTKVIQGQNSCKWTGCKLGRIV